MKQPEFKYKFYASLLDSFTEFLDVKAEEFFYKDENGEWHMNMNQDGELHYSEEEVYQLAKQQFIDKVNRVDDCRQGYRLQRDRRLHRHECTQHKG